MRSEVDGSDEFRRHPSSVLFGILGVVRGLILPWLFAFLASGGRRSPDTWLLLLVVPATVVAVLDYLLVRYALDREGLVIQRGFVFRNVRHIPYSRIQNIDLRQNPVHRWLGVAEVTIQTASGNEAEARLRVLSLPAVETLRRRVFAGRSEDVASTRSEEARQTLLALGPKELTLFGLLHGRGFVVAAAAAGLAWQWLVPDDAVFWAGRPWENLPSLHAGVAAGLFGVGLLVLLLLLLRVLSVAWAFVTLAGFRLERRGEDLRTTGGLLTRRQATLPRHRIQVLTIEEGVLARAFGRVLVQADTAGGGGEDGEGRSEASRAWIAPVLPRTDLPNLLAEVTPEIDLPAAAWRPISSRAFPRLARKRALVCLALGAGLSAGLGPAGWIPVVLVLPLLLGSAWVRVRTTAWATLPRALAVRTGWWTRRTRLVRYAKMQVVRTLASGFDRRARMAHVHVDTAAARSGEIVVPGLAQEDARALAARLGEAVERTRFEW